MRAIIANRTLRTKKFFGINFCGSGSITRHSNFCTMAAKKKAKKAAKKKVAKKTTKRRKTAKRK